MNKEQSLLPIEEGYNTVTRDVSMIADDSIIALAAQVEKRLEAVNKMMTAALKITTILDWCLIGGRPYLQESGATKIARLFGVSWQIDEPRKETRGDGHYTYTYRGRFGLSGSWIEAEGARSSYDEFFTGREKKDKEGNVTSKPKSPDEIDVRDVKIAAYTNCINNGIKRLIPGLRNITVETLQSAGLDTSRIGGYGFNNSAGKEESQESADKRAEIKRMLDEASGGDAAKFVKMLKKYTSFTKSDGSEFPGYDRIDRISEKSIAVTYGKVKAAYEDWKKKQAGTEQGDEPNEGDEQ